MLFDGNIRTFWACNTVITVPKIWWRDSYVVSHSFAIFKSSNEHKMKFLRQCRKMAFYWFFTMCSFHFMTKDRLLVGIRTESAKSMQNKLWISSILYEHRSLCWRKNQFFPSNFLAKRLNLGCIRNVQTENQKYGLFIQYEMKTVHLSFCSAFDSLERNESFYK